MGSKNPHTVIIGSGNGTISVLELSKLVSAQPHNKNDLADLEKEYEEFHEES